MVLWVLILGLCSGAVALFGGSLPGALRARVLAVLGMVSAGFLLFILATSNPFTRVWPAPMDGQGLNPVLQDPGLAFHPPILYAGYVGFAVTFAFAVAALIEGRVDAAWGRWVRPWALQPTCPVEATRVAGAAAWVGARGAALTGRPARAARGRARAKGEPTMTVDRATPAEGARLRRPRWRDPRLLVGLVLVLASVAGVVALLTAALADR